jgi:hypothetical protein
LKASRSLQDLANRFRNILHMGRLQSGKAAVHPNSKVKRGRTFMKKLINSADLVLAESLDGFAAAHADVLLLGAERKFVRRCTLKPGKVALISGGGSGHEPLHAGCWPRHARCRMPRPGLHLADAGSDDRGS